MSAQPRTVSSPLDLLIKIWCFGVWLWLGSSVSGDQLQGLLSGLLLPGIAGGCPRADLLPAGVDVAESSEREPGHE